MSRRNQALWAGVILSACVGLGFYVATLKFIESDSRERFGNHARNAQINVDARIKSYTNVLRSTASLFSTSDTISRSQFHAYVTGLQLARHFPAIERMNFAEFVTHANRPAYERRMLAEQNAGGFNGPPFRITPPGVRSGYSVITFVEPNLPWDGAYGFDLHANDYARHRVMESSRDGGSLIASGLPIPAISTPSSIGLAMRLPVYRPNLPVGTVAERRAAYLGSVGIAFSVPKLVRGVVDQMPIRNVRLTLVDASPSLAAPGAKLPASRVLFDSIASDANPAPPLRRPEDGFSKTLPIDFNGHTWMATFSVDKQALYSGFDEYFPWLAMVAGFIVSMLMYALLHTLTASRSNAIRLAEEMTRELRASQASLQLSHINLRRLAAHADNIKESERKRIAREIHDDLGQNLLALRIEADVLCARTRGGHQRLHARACATLQQIDATLQSVRLIINDLRPNVLDLGLGAAVEWQVGEFRRLTGVACELAGNAQEVKVSDHCATALFRILQESLSNISRHAHASAVKVELRTAGDHVRMSVSDNGIGLRRDGESKPGSFGLVGIEERMRILGGTFEIASVPGLGTSIKVTVPLQADQRYLDKEMLGQSVNAEFSPA
ncbi:MAG: CHASE domain-containing protein [Telluria sp.]